MPNSLASTEPDVEGTGLGIVVLSAARYGVEPDAADLAGLDIPEGVDPAAYCLGVAAACHRLAWLRTGGHTRAATASAHAYLMRTAS